MSNGDDDRAAATGHEPADEEALRRLLRAAGPRPELPADDLTAIAAAGRRVWERRHGRRRRHLPAIAAAALAASIAAAAALLWWWTRPPAAPLVAPAPVATLEVLRGEALVAERGDRPAVQLGGDALGRELPAGAELITADAAAGGGRLALRMAGGSSLRLDSGTRVRLLGPGLVELAAGALYVDTPAGRRGVAVRTAAGTFRELGTQFEVRIAGGATRLRVREGRVALGEGAGAVTAAAGEELRVRAGAVSRHAIPGGGSPWEWVLAAAPPLAIDGLTVRQFLDRTARETGWVVATEDAATAALLDSVVLHGSIVHVAPDRAPALVLPSCGLAHRLEGNRLVVFRRAA